MLIQRLFLCLYFLTIFSLKIQAQEQPAAQVIQNVQTSLVEVRAENIKTFDEGNGHMKTATYHSQGSGVILDSYGVIVTNAHIISSAQHIYVGLSDGTVLEAKVVHSSDADFCFLKVEPPYPLTAITYADNSTAQIGTPIIALSNDDGDQEHVLSGEITNLIEGMSSNTVELYELNLNLYHGDSGGPLLDNQGQLLGLIMGKKLSEDNKTYAIAASKIINEYQQYQTNLK